jgi:CO/xanthine dehydrogenase Mo-binding subunit
MRRTDGAEKVSGALIFTEDMPLAGMAHAKLVLSYSASARVRGIQIEAALALPGVLAVLTGAQLGLEMDGPDAPLARDRVSYVGQPVVAVVGETAAAAADGAALVDVDYEPLPAAVEPEQAIREDAPRVIPETHDEAGEASLHGAASAETETAPRAVGNVSSQVEFQRGDVGQGLARSAVRVEHAFSLARVHHGFLEPHVVTAAVHRDGSVTVWSPTQGMSAVRDSVARSLELGGDRVRVVPMPVGGGFGGKIEQLEPLVAHLARLVGRPVRLQLTRNEEFLLGRPAPAARIALELGATADGALSALRGEVRYDNGATGGWHAGITCELMISTYRLPSFQVSGSEVATNKLPVTSYRAPGAPQAYFALESCVDELARELGVDAIDFRLGNASREGDPRGDGSPWPRIGLVSCLEAARRHPAYVDARRAGEGVGVAVGSWPGAYGPAAAACRVEADGTLALHLGSIDISGSDTGFAMLAAETFGTSPERVRILRTDSATSPESPIAAGSATTYSVGPAVARAVLEVRRQVLDLAGSHLEAAVDDLELAAGEVRVKGAPFRSVSVREVAGMAQRAGGPGPIHAVGRASVGGPAPMFCVHVARVRVDADTGSVAVTRYVAIHDVGHALNRDGVVGQIHGGVLQGLGRALGEEIVYDASGQLRTGSFADYSMPTVDMAPPIEVELLEVPSEHGPGGARGIGEPPVVPVVAALGNAIRDATGIRLTSAPFSPETLAGYSVPLETGRRRSAELRSMKS